MSNSAPISPVGADSGAAPAASAQAPSPPAPSQQASSTPTAAPSPTELIQDQSGVTNPADLRLVIEEDKAAGTFVYKTVDWRTGEVVQQLPREQVLQLREIQNYAPGKVVAAKV